MNVVAQYRSQLVLKLMTFRGCVTTEFVMHGPWSVKIARMKKTLKKNFKYVKNVEKQKKLYDKTFIKSQGVETLCW